MIREFYHNSMKTLEVDRKIKNDLDLTEKIKYLVEMEPEIRL